MGLEGGWRCVCVCVWGGGVGREEGGAGFGGQKADMHVWVNESV